MKKISFFFLCYLFIPIIAFAYSDYIIASGKNIGIELKSNNVIVVGAYDISSYNALRDSDLRLGDKILKIDDYPITDANSMQKIINKIDKSVVSVLYKRDGKNNLTKINLYKENGEYKTGLFVRDTIRGVATLTYIDEDSKKFGALGHEIVERSTKTKFDADGGTIFSSFVTGVTKSSDGSPGEKNAKSNSQDVYGVIKENTYSGIFGDYTSQIPPTKKYKVAKPEEIKLGNAKILTVIDGDKVEAFDVNIIKINANSPSKNILIEVTDEKLLNKTGGIVQGMSGSPIIQGDYIVGAVNFVIVDKTSRGYGIFITTMLEEAENN